MKDRRATLGVEIIRDRREWFEFFAHNRRQNLVGQPRVHGQDRSVRVGRPRARRAKAVHHPIVAATTLHQTEGFEPRAKLRSSAVILKTHQKIAVTLDE